MSRFNESSLYQLTSTRFRLFLREPEAIFWVFIFPILLAVGLGIAFRNRPADVLPVAGTTAQLTQALAADRGLSATTMDEPAGTHALAIGTNNLLAIQVAVGVPIRGSMIDLGIICLVTSLAFSALGLLVASRAKTMEAASGLMNLVMLPMWILSGVFFSATRFPAVIQPLVRALPLTAAIDALRSNMLQGIGLNHLAMPMAILLAWLAVPFVVTMKIFRWR